MAHAMNSSADVSGCAHLPEGIAGRVAGGAAGSDALTLMRVEGFGPSVAFRIATLQALLAGTGRLEPIAEAFSRLLWREIRDCIPFADGGEQPVWRVSLPPSGAHRMVLQLRMQAGADAFYDWQGGLVWLRMEADPEAELVRRLVRSHGGGHATLIRASAALRARLPVFEPQPPALAALSARLKSQFDPMSILNPGRMTPHAD
jgi:glycolate oxidase FAD binding subunit